MYHFRQNVSSNAIQTVGLVAWAKNPKLYLVSDCEGGCFWLSFVLCCPGGRYWLASTATHTICIASKLQLLWGTLPGNIWKPQYYLQHGNIQWLVHATTITTTTVYFNEVVFPSVLGSTSPMAFPQHSPPSWPVPSIFPTKSLHSHIFSQHFSPSLPGPTVHFVDLSYTCQEKILKFISFFIMLCL